MEFKKIEFQVIYEDEWRNRINQYWANIQDNLRLKMIRY